jgi:hypothetical protein
MARHDDGILQVLHWPIWASTKVLGLGVLDCASGVGGFFNFFDFLTR